MDAGQLPHDNALAVVGMACRLPGADDPDAFWRLLLSGVDSVSSVPPGRWATPGEGADAATGFGAFLDDVAGFDAEFFGVSPREAAAMDPQQRLVLELVWTALEDAGIVPAALAGRSVGVFVGAMRDDYAVLSLADEAAIDPTAVTGTQRAVIANRVSYALGLRGPSMTVDTAQSSSLVALHLAAGSLRSGESEVAVAAGVNLNLLRSGAVAAARFGGLSPDGRCFTFDARANGFVRGEGAGVVVLKPLARAVADGDPVHCVLLGSAVNNDGATSGLTVPGVEAQCEVLRAACADAGVDPGALQYVELHGSGTRVGDPVEAAALGAARGDAAPLPVGSVKTNLGHLEGAGGIVGFIKTALAVEHGVIPPTLNHEHPNPDIDLERLRLRVVTAAEDWPGNGEPRLAGVSSFGMGGTNCHVVLGAAPPARPAPAPGPVDAVCVPLSGRTEDALRAQADRLAAHLDRDQGADLAAVAHAAATTRTGFGHRAAVVARDHPELVRALRATAEGLPDPATTLGRARPTGRTLFVFPGQGSQWVGMAGALLDSSPVFRDSIDECAEALAPFTDWSLHEVLRGGDGLDRVEVVQPALFAVMVSLAAVWRSLGVRPDAVLGHSQGEIAAACVAGALTLADAAEVVALRSRALAALAGTGTMAVVALPAERVRSLLGAHPGLEVAALNSPVSTVVSGPEAAVVAFVAACEGTGVRARRVAVDYASHCAQVDVVRERLLRDLDGLTPRAPQVAFYSTTTGERVAEPVLDAQYWFDNLRSPVLFAGTVETALADGHDVVVEVSPHPVLLGAVAEVAEARGADPVLAETLRRDSGDWARVLTSAAALHVAGAPVDWARSLPAVPATRPRLPTYPFQRRPYWLPGTAATSPVTTPPAATAPAHTTPVHDPAPAEQRALSGPRVLALVRAHTAVVLGHTDGAAIDPTSTFKELGLDSRTAVELRDRVGAATGVRLPTSAVYDHPTPSALAEALRARLGEEDRPEPVAAAGAHAADDDPVAIIAVGCRLPGARSPEELWRLLVAETDATGDIPADRGWDLEHPVPISTRRGGFLADAGDFDADLFGIRPREAEAMDPQQRLLLELAWEVFERAGLDTAALRGSRTGVFAGVMAQDYGPRMHDRTPLTGYLLTGSATSVASGRIAYTFGLRGPAITLDTACSSSLVAVHTAAAAVRAGECSLALAGGATVMANPGLIVEFEKQGGLAADGRCKSFSAAADGTAWGEGAALVLLERLSDARRNGHPVLAVLRGSAVNSDGASNGLTAPNGRAQVEVIRDALAAAGLRAGEVDAVEAHGSGTVLGDPIEALALADTYGRERAPEDPVWLGSLKSNTGHTQAAAGAAGLVKVVLALRHELLPRSLHVTEPTPHVDWSRAGVRVLDRAVPWPAGDRPRRAAVSAFGIGGTNAHVVLEEAPREPSTMDSTARPADSVGPADGGEPAVVAWPLSAATPAALGAQAERLRGFAADHGDVPPAEVAAALTRCRTALRERAVVLGPDRAAVVAGLGALAGGRSTREVVRGAVVAGGTALLFTGQGSQRVGMGVELAGAFPVFAAALAEVFAHLDPDLPRVVAEEPDLLNRTEYAQPALFAIQVALHRLLADWGVTPDFLAGHSIGEIAAAHVAGVLSLPDACLLVTARGRLMQALPETGAMLAVEATEDEVGGLLGAELAVAAVNGPRSLVLSGAEHAVDAAARHFPGAKRLRVSHAFHSPLMEPALREWRRVAGGVTYHPARVPVVSTVTGRLTTADDLASADYWVRHAAGTVRFHDAVGALAAEGVRTFLEVGPGGVLSALGPACLPSVDDALFTPLLRRDKPEARTAVAAVAAAHVRGVAVDWARVGGHTGPVRVELPTYAFQRERYWAASGAGEAPQVTTTEWRYREEWTPIAPRRAADPTGTWVLVTEADRDGRWTRALTEALTGRGARVHHLPAGDDRAELTRRLRALDRVDAVVSPPALADLPRTLALVTAVADLDRPVPLWLLTEGAVGTGADDPVRDPAQAQVWGLGRTAALEHPGCWGGLVDLPTDPDGAVVDRLLGVLARPGAEDQVAIRGTAVLGRRVRQAPAAVARERWRPTGTVLVTGGTGALGAHLTRWLADGGAEHVVLASRRGAAAEGVAALSAELAERSVGVTAVACDVTDAGAVTALLDDLAAGGRPVHTAIHAAGVNHVRPLAETTPDDLRRVLRGKAGGARVLGDLLAAGRVRELVLFSSAAGVWGGRGQGAYAAANAHLDALAQDLRSRGHRAVSIAWGTWAGAGMGADEELARGLARSGMRPLPPRQALRALGEVLTADQATITVADIDRDRFAALFSAARERNLFDGMVAAEEVTTAGTAPLRAELAALAPDDRHRHLLAIVLHHAAAVRDQDTTDEFPPDQALRDLGFDSLMSVELRDRLQEATGLPLARTVVYEHPSAQALALHLLGELDHDGEEDLAALVDRLESAVAAAAVPPACIIERLTALCDRARGGGDSGGPGATGADRIAAATDDELFDLIDGELRFDTGSGARDTGTSGHRP
ncbi:SDR family NAD(P)-dependent oxidoreductase [Actinokineospora sp. PR83]|uniref:type I polyketide synthase n=1 Tax=Actinokineospora sp. PR83 TaxID=2884908 RepID=UPI001F43E791|nr:type I polyketide synthase [Actinokineospora sp. PR83]MCG8917163.1 SDR family NAD(P)-dependent oxidoreductase [Actinokineospora sp. PR83]